MEERTRGFSIGGKGKLHNILRAPSLRASETRAHCERELSRGRWIGMMHEETVGRNLILTNIGSQAY